MFTFSIPAATIFSAASSFIIESAGTNTSPVSGCTIGSIVYLPTILSYISSITSFPSFIARTSVVSVVPQSISLTITSWLTSTSLLVK